MVLDAEIGYGVAAAADTTQMSGNESLGWLDSLGGV
jgi:hypothetical protein